MIKRILISIVFYLMGMATTLVAQAAVIDLSQTILLEGSVLNFSVIIYQSETAFFTIDLVDSEGKPLQNYVINPAEGVNTYALAVPVDIPEQAWLVIRNGDEIHIEELLILPRPKQFIEQSHVSMGDNTATRAHKQTENICLQDYPDSLVYLSSTAATFNGCLFQFDKVKNFVNYPMKVEGGQISQVHLFDATNLKPMKITQGKNNTAVMLKATNAGSTLFAVNKLTNLPEKLDFTIAPPTPQSIFSNIDKDNKKWLANQLLIDEVVSPLSDKDFSVKIKSKENTNLTELKTATINLKPQDYVAFDDMKSFLNGLARNLKLYPSGEGYGSYIYPIHKKASIRQPLYIIDRQIAVVDDLLSMKQEDILSIQVYTEVQSLVQTIGPVASAGLIIVKSVEPKTINHVKVGQALSSLPLRQFDRPLSPLAFMGSCSQNCYVHNMRLGVFNVNGISIVGKALKVHHEQINIIPLSK